ncbi:MAG: hypothetical protein WD872_16480 [Pirellulaceae bacterium]
MPDRGKLVVLSIFAVALVAASFAWWWNYNRGRKALEFYGPQAARLIRTAPTVEILVPIEWGDPAANNGDVDGGVIPDIGYSIRRRIDVSQAPGLIHARTSLLDDASYQWNADQREQVFTYFVRFADGADEVVIAFSEPDGWVMQLDSDTSSSNDPSSRVLAKKTAAGWRAFILRNIEAKLAKSTPLAPAHTDPSE